MSDVEHDDHDDHDEEIGHLDPIAVADPGLADFAEALFQAGQGGPSQWEVYPDLADVVARAHRIDPGRVSAAMVDQAGRIELDDEPVEDDGALVPFLDALRQSHEAAIAERGMAGIPPAPGLEVDGEDVTRVSRDDRAVRRGRALGAGLGVLVAVAAAIGALWVLAPSLLQQSGPQDATQAADAEREGESSGVATIFNPEPEVARAPRRVEPHRAIAPAPAVDQEPEPEPEPAPAPEPEAPAVDQEPESPAVDHEPAPAPKVSKRKRLAELEARAQEAWKAGELAEAERLLRKVIKLDGKGKAAQLAYGDLFSVARRRGGAKAQAEVWSEYLRRFPRGRFAEDARAGLCGRARGEKARTCWQDYLDRHPDGAHRSKARSVLGDAP